MGKKMKLALLFVFAGIVAAVSAWAFFFASRGGDVVVSLKLDRPLRVGMECAFAPYNWEEDKASATNVPIRNGKGVYAEGYDVQIIKRVAKNLGAEIEIHKVAWENLLPDLNSGKLDMVVSGMADTEARRKMVAFSDIYNAHPADYSIMTRKDSRYADGSTLADFYNARMVGQKDSVLDAVIDQIYGVKHLPPIESIPQMFEHLEENRADGIVINTESAQAYLKEYPNMAVVQFARNEGFEPGFTGICVAVRKKDTKLLEAINMALSGISTKTRLELIDQMKAKAEKADKVM
ncbi:MAG: transporter substrate-binding domain-containing protein [Fretibacterium sp.]|nr:transporter substrate-binding domain-containing protein [Fretibacterium sp.]